jgi:ketosteroid isomerase-like protein
MAGKATEQLRHLIEAFEAGGTDAAIAQLDPEIAWVAPPEWLEERVYRGHDGVRELAGYWTQQFDQYRLDLKRLIDLDDGRGVALLHHGGRIRESGAPVQHEIGYIGEADAGKLTRVEVYFSWEATLEAAGLQEDPPDPG